MYFYKFKLFTNEYLHCFSIFLQMLQLYARCQCLPENGSCRWKVVVVVVSRQRLVTETWKALTWSTNRHSSASHAQTRLPHLNHTSVGGECACLCVSARVYHLNVLPFIDLKTRGFCAPVKPHVEVAARFIRSLHLSTVPPFFFFPSPFLLFGGVISVYWVTRFPRVT